MIKYNKIIIIIIIKNNKNINKFIKTIIIIIKITLVYMRQTGLDSILS